MATNEITSQVFPSINSYWRHRNYQRLRAPSKQLRVVRLGGTSQRRPWKARTVRFRAIVKLPSVLWSPIGHVLTRIRDAYMDAMLALADGARRPSKLALTGGGGGLWARRIPKARQVAARKGDFEQRMMVHIYNSLVAAPELPGVYKT